MPGQLPVCSLVSPLLDSQLPASLLLLPTSYLLVYLDQRHLGRSHACSHDCDHQNHYSFLVGCQPELLGGPNEDISEGHREWWLSIALPLPRAHAAQNLDLTNNSLVGTIPSSIGALTALATLDLTGNDHIALSVGKALDLKTLGAALGIAAAAVTALVFCILLPTIRRRRRRLMKISAMMVRVALLHACLNSFALWLLSRLFFLCLLMNMQWKIAAWLSPPECR